MEKPKPRLADPTTRETLKQVLIAWDTEAALWPMEEVKRAQAGFDKHNGGVPPYPHLIDLFGKEPLDEVFSVLVQERKAEINALQRLQGINDPCHACGSTEKLTYHPFGLVRVQEVKWNWTSTGLSVALTAITLPLLGGGALYGPKKTVSGNLVRLRLVLCESCLRARMGLWGEFAVKSHDCDIHPLWKELFANGFKKFVKATELNHWK